MCLPEGLFELAAYIVYYNRTPIPMYFQPYHIGLIHLVSATLPHVVYFLGLSWYSKPPHLHYCYQGIYIPLIDVLREQHIPILLL